MTQPPDPRAAGPGHGRGEPPAPAGAPGEPPADALAVTAEGGPARGEARARRRAERRRRLRVTLAVALAVVLVLVGLSIGWYESKVNPSGPQGAGVIISVNGGEGNDAVLADLAQHGVIASTLAFRIYDAIHGSPRYTGTSTISPGRYYFHANMPFGAVDQVFAHGPDVYSVSTVPGFTLAEVANAVSDDLPGRSASGFLDVAKSGAVTSPWDPPGSDDLEGLVAAGTYTVVPGESDAELLGQMVTRFNVQAAAAGLSTASAAKLGLTAYQVITAASVVQKEGYYDENMPPVARVIYNRLANAMPLQMDSTVLYSLGQDGGTVTPADLQLNTPYNTYLHTGLPPTPICIPSPTALAAAVNPPPGAWLYFVVVNKDGKEAFADTFAQQLANEKLAQQDGAG